MAPTIGSNHRTTTGLHSLHQSLQLANALAFTRERAPQATDRRVQRPVGQRRADQDYGAPVEDSEN